MKKYFTKYLPIEGEIEIGDRVESETSGKPKVVVTGITEKGDFITNERDFYETNSYFILPKEKAKRFSKQLFLCTNHIEVGDVFNHRGYHESVVTTINNGFVYNGTAHRFKIENCWKVIGQISENATWVKEGDEFDEEKLYYLLGGMSVRRPMKYFVNVKSEWKIDPEDITIFVECPHCKKF